MSIVEDNSAKRAAAFKQFISSFLSLNAITGNPQERFVVEVVCIIYLQGMVLVNMRHIAAFLILGDICIA